MLAVVVASPSGRPQFFGLRDIRALNQALNVADEIASYNAA